MDAPPSKPKLKLNFSAKTVSSAGIPSTPGGASTPVPTSAVVTPSGNKLKLKFTNNSNPPTPAPIDDLPKPKKTKAGRVPKASAKLTESKKRVKEESSDDEDGSTINVQPYQKKVKLHIKSGVNGVGIQSATTPKTPVVKIQAKFKGKAPKRLPGEGYDSEASDAEQDPHIEEQFVLRMYPGEDCDYLQRAIAEKKIGVAKSQGGADVQMRFYPNKTQPGVPASTETRRASITIRGNKYAAVMVDLPCIIEGMKSWDRRGWWKSADISQMLWVYSRIAHEAQAVDLALPKGVDPKTFQYAHGLTPPMHYVRKRRFRKRISVNAIEEVEKSVAALLARDADALGSRWEMFNPNGDRASAFSDDSEGGSEDGEGEYDEEDADGEIDDGGYFHGTHHNGQEATELDAHDADLEADLEAAMQEEFMGATPVSTTDATPAMASETPAAEEEEEEEDSGDESIEGDDDDDDAAGDVEDDEAKALEAARQGTLEDIADIDKRIGDLETQLTITSNPILRRRIEENIRKNKIEKQLKEASIGIGVEDDDE